MKTTFEANSNELQRLKDANEKLTEATGKANAEKDELAQRLQEIQDQAAKKEMSEWEAVEDESEPKKAKLHASKEPPVYKAECGWELSKEGYMTSWKKESHTTHPNWWQSHQGWQDDSWKRGGVWKSDNTLVLRLEDAGQLDSVEPDVELLRQMLYGFACEEGSVGDIVNYQLGNQDSHSSHKHPFT